MWETIDLVLMKTSNQQSTYLMLGVILIPVVINIGSVECTK